MIAVKKIICLILCVCWFGVLTNAQIQHGGKPLSLTATFLDAKKIPIETMPNFDKQKMLEEDAELNVKGNPFRFGKEFDVDFNLEKSGLWETLPNGDKLWRLAIASEGAFSMNFLFDDFFLPEGATLFMYNENYEEILGAFTAENNKAYRRFSTTVIKGDKITFEYYEPKNVKEKGVISFFQVVHAYHNFYDKAQKGYGDSGACNINVNCDIAAEWEDQVNSVAMIMQGGYRLCSGAMINGVREDGRPYYLTANHCRPNTIEDVQYWSFLFNYQSSGCGNEDGATNMSVSGAIPLANNANSDFMLLELSSHIPLNYNVFYNGWDMSGEQPTMGVGIHHPSGDIKKISFDYDALLSAENSSGGVNYWEVSDWNDGTTEGGSSGSPIFNENKLLVGQLYGGDAACGNDLYDVYGKFSVSWGNKNNIAGSIAPWVNPDETEITSLEGTYLADVISQNDASILLATDFASTFCENYIDLPDFSVKNLGLNNITAAEIVWQLDEQTPETINWTGTLASLKTTLVELPAVSTTYGAHLLSIEIININGNDFLDENSMNDKILIPFEVIAGGQSLEISINTDDYGSETSFELINTQNSETIINDGNFESNTNYNFETCLLPGCYTFTINDSYGDGICCGFGNGDFALNLSNEGNIGVGGEFTLSESISFCVDAEGGLPNIESLTISSNKVCIGEGISLGVAANTYDAVEWSFYPNILPTVAEENTFVIPSEIGVYTAILKLTNEFGVNEQQLSFEVFDFPNYQLYEVNNTLLDNEGSVEIEATFNSTILWEDGNTNFLRDKLTEGVYEFTITGEGGCQVFGEAVIDVLFDSPIYPNPISDGIMNVYNPAESLGEVAIYDIQGKRIGNYIIESGRNQLDVSNLTAGLYVVHYNYETEMIVKKVFVR